MRLTDRNRDVHNIVLLAIVCLVLQLALAPNIALLQDMLTLLVFLRC